MLVWFRAKKLGVVVVAVIEKRKTKEGETRYRVKIRLAGHPALTETHHRLADAKRWAHQTETAIREGRYFKAIEAKKHTLAEMIDRYIRDVLPKKPKSKRKQESQLLWWKEQLGAYVLADVTPALLAEKRDEFLRGTTSRGSQRSPSTVVRYLSALSHAFSVAVREWGWLEDSPMRKVARLKEPKGRVKFLEAEERERLLQACKESANPHLHPVVLLAISTGMRYGEIINLTWSDVDLARRRIILHETKNGERRAVPIAGAALEVLASLEKKKLIDAYLLFPKKTPESALLDLQKPDQSKVQKVQKPAVLRQAWLAALKNAGIKDFRFHDLRHCAASYLAMSGASLAEIAEVLGHKTLAMVKRYAHLSESHQHSVIDRMNKKFLGDR